MSKKNQTYNVICYSNQLWDFPNWTNKKHVMARLSSLGHNVLFVDPPINVGRVFFRQLMRGNWGIKRLLTWTKVDKEYSASIFSPLNFQPLQSVNTMLHTKMVRNSVGKLFDKDKKTILWVYNVQLINLEYVLDNIPHDILVYDCVDNYAGFPQDSNFYSTTVSKQQLLEQEKTLAERADIVFATAPGLVDHLNRYNKNVHFMPNVGDYLRFKDSKAIKNLPEDIKQIKRPIVAFVGALDEYKFDFKLFKKILVDHPKVSFVLIGQNAIKDRSATLDGLGLENYKNVYFLGQKKFEEMPSYYSAFDAYIIPYVLNDYTVGGCFPVKFHESLAVGLPTIVTDLPAYKPFSDVCYISKTYQEFSDNIRLALDEDTKNKILLRQKVASNNTWDQKVKNMLNLIGYVDEK